VSGLGRPFAGCLDLVVTYDTTNYHDKHLSKFRSTAEVGIVCLGPAEAELHGAGS